MTKQEAVRKIYVEVLRTGAIMQVEHIEAMVRPYPSEVEENAVNDLVQGILSQVHIAQENAMKTQVDKCPKENITCAKIALEETVAAGKEYLIPFIGISIPPEMLEIHRQVVADDGASMSPRAASMVEDAPPAPDEEWKMIVVCSSAASMGIRLLPCEVRALIRRTPEKSAKQLCHYIVQYGKQKDTLSNVEIYEGEVKVAKPVSAFDIFDSDPADYLEKAKNTTEPELTEEEAATLLTLREFVKAHELSPPDEALVFLAKVAGDKTFPVNRLNEAVEELSLLLKKVQESVSASPASGNFVSKVPGTDTVH